MLRIRSSLTNVVLAIVMIPVVLALYQNHGSNRHVHVLPSGEVIEHSHPLQKSKSSGQPVPHNHDLVDLVFLGQLSDNETPVSVFIPVFDEFAILGEQKRFQATDFFLPDSPQPNPQRGPPSLFSRVS